MRQTTGDHIFGLAPLLAARLNGAGGMVEEENEVRVQEAQTQGKEVRPQPPIYTPAIILIDTAI